MDGETEGAPLQEMPVFGAGHHMERAVDGNRHNGQLQLIGQHECTLLEVAHGSRIGARALGKHHHAHAAAQRGTRLSIGLAHLARAALVDEYLMRSLAGHTHKGDFPDASLHHPLEVAAKVAVEKEDVERALVIGHEDVGLVGLEMLPALHSDGQQTELEREPRPAFAGIVTPEIAIAKQTAYGDSQGGNNRENEEEGQSHDQLIKTIEIFHSGRD